MDNNTQITARSIGEQVIQRIDEKCSAGLTFPTGYSYNNAITAAMLAIQDLKGNPLATCTPASIQQALFKMAIYGQNVIDGQGYFIMMGNQLTYRESYFGKVMRVRRIYPNWQPVPRIIYKSDVFEYATDPDTGFMKIVRHEQRIENIDEGFDIEKGFRGAYMYYPLPGGKQDLYIMTNLQIRKAWSKSEMKSLNTHHAFTSKMIAKTLINSCCSMIINTQPEFASQEFYAAEEESESEPLVQSVDVQEIEVVEEIPVAQPVVDQEDTAEIDVRQDTQNDTGNTPQPTESTSDYDF